jgi:hypothetical protein
MSEPPKFHHLTGAQVLSWWREVSVRAFSESALCDKNPKDRVPWAPGLPMSAKSLASARRWNYGLTRSIFMMFWEWIDRKRSYYQTLFLSWQARP